MSGKLFASTFTGSMMAAGAEVFAVWAYIIAHAIESRVEINARLLAAVIGSPPERINEVLDFLCSPDPESRNPDADGRRLIKEGQFQYFVTSHSRYRMIGTEEERREYNRLAKQRSRGGRDNDEPGEPAGDAGDAGDEPVFKATARAEVGMAFKRAGIDPTRINMSHPTLIALLEQGATIEEFEGLAREAVQKRISGPVAWICATLQGRREQAQAIALAPQTPANDRKSRQLETAGLMTSTAPASNEPETVDDKPRLIAP